MFAWVAPYPGVSCKTIKKKEICGEQCVPQNHPGYKNRTTM